MKSGRHSVCRSEQLPEGGSFVFEMAAKQVAVYRVNSQLYAIDDVCPHMGASLSSGSIENLIVTCPWHYWRFRLEDGAWADNQRVKIGCYKVVEEAGEIWIELPAKT